MQTHKEKVVEEILSINKKKKINKYFVIGIAVSVFGMSIVCGFAGCSHDDEISMFPNHGEVENPSSPEKEKENSKIDSEFESDNIGDNYNAEQESEQKPELEEQFWNEEAGYNLSVSRFEQQEAENDCIQIMKYYSDIYMEAEKGDALNVVLSDETILKIQERIKIFGASVATKMEYAKIENYHSLDTFLKNCLNNEKGESILYEIHADGGIGRIKFIFDGADMYVLSADAVWNKKNEPLVVYITYNKIEKWEYTPKGWFCYLLCVPDESQVSEIVDGSRMVRVIPLGEEQVEFSKKCVQSIGYQGNNLLCSNWDVEHMEQLDFNGLYEALYEMKYQKRFSLEDSSVGIAKEEFENLIMEYLPITRDEIQKYAVFDDATQTYVWARVGANFMLSFFGNSVPEVTKVQKNENGTITLTVEAVCDKVIYDDALITHELLIRMQEDGSFQYLGNQVLGDGLEQIPEYQYRVSNK